MSQSFIAPPFETAHLGSLIVPRLWIGLWQLSGNAWGTASAAKIRQGMGRHVDQGYIAFDMADHYGSAEILFGQFRASLPSDQTVIGATKWCVFRPTIPSREVVEDAVLQRMARMRTDCVDLLQLHWQDYADIGYMTALSVLCELKLEGKIREIGLCNFDSRRTDQICTQMGPGIIVSNQVQFSLVDNRPLHGMSDVCERHSVKLLTYGTLCGGFLADKWVNEPEPDLYTANLTPSQRKYLDMIVKAWGNWELFQELLAVLRTIGDRHSGLSIANIATRWVLDHPFVGAVLIGTRLGVSEHPDDNQHAFGFSLSQEDRAAIDVVLQRSNSRTMITTVGDCGDEYR